MAETTFTDLLVAQHSSDEPIKYTDVVPIDVEPGVPLALEPLPELTVDEDTFALAVVEYGGNLAKAWEAAFGESRTPGARARLMLARPEIQERIRQITASVQDNALISLGSHMVELAEIRDLAKAQGALKVALGAEQARGQVAGFYAGKAGGPGGKSNDNPMVVVQINNQIDRDI